MMKAITTNIIAIKSNTTNQFISPLFTRLTVPAIAFGILATIPAKMIRDIPFPMPFSVICSPSHIIKEVPPVRVIMVISRKLHPGL